jgi:hypothetical protein
MTAKKQYLNILQRQRTDWLQFSMANPTCYMTPVQAALHGIVLRSRGADIPKTINWVR